MSGTDLNDHGLERGLPCIDLFGIPFHAITEGQCIEHISAELSAGRGGWVVTPNIDHLRRLTHHEELRELYSGATLAVADGMPLVWAARLQRTPLPCRVAGSSLIWSLSEAAARMNGRLYLLGGEPGTAEVAARVLEQRFPGLVVAGTDSPPMGFENDTERMMQLVDGLVAAEPDIIFVGLGSPKQEWLIRKLREVLPSAWWMGVGISFNFVAGRMKRAPLWMQRTGLEWVHRLVQEPRRLGRRYLIEDVPFTVGLLLRCAFLGLRSR